MQMQLLLEEWLVYINPLEEIAQRCIRVVGTLETDIGGCVLCCISDFNDSTVIICDQCEKEYHVGCLREQNIDDLKKVPENEWFCCTECSNINCTPQKLIVDGEQMLPQPALDILKKKCEGKGLENSPNLDIKWRLLSGKKASEETRVWFSRAVTIFHDCFDPIFDSSTGRDLIPDLVYGRQFNGQDLCCGSRIYRELRFVFYSLVHRYTNRQQVKLYKRL